MTLPLILPPGLTSQFWILTAVLPVFCNVALPTIPQGSEWLGFEVSVDQGHQGPVSQFCRQILI